MEKEQSQINMEICLFIALRQEVEGYRWFIFSSERFLQKHSTLLERLHELDSLVAVLDDGLTVDEKSGMENFCTKRRTNTCRSSDPQLTRSDFDSCTTLSVCFPNKYSVQNTILGPVR